MALKNRKPPKKANTKRHPVGPPAEMSIVEYTRQAYTQAQQDLEDSLKAQKAFNDVARIYQQALHEQISRTRNALVRMGKKP